jgi:hypothetical protein
MRLVLLGRLGGDNVFWIGFGVGTVVGVAVMIFTLALCKAGED